MIQGFRTKMLTGAEFVKVSRVGVPEVRHVCCDKSLQQIWWRGKAHLRWGHIDVKDVKAVVLGRSTLNFLLCDGNVSQPIKLVNASFSIITKDRSLDLVCANENARADWLEYFAFLFRGVLKRSALLMMGDMWRVLGQHCNQDYELTD